MVQSSHHGVHMDCGSWLGLDPFSSSGVNLEKEGSLDDLAAFLHDHLLDHAAHRGLDHHLP